jgi:chemotaxis protein methyltransferase CheR
MIKLAAAERPLVSGYIHSICSIILDGTKDYLIENRLSAVAGSLGCGTFTDLVRRAQADVGGTINRKIINEITTRETLFFRDSAPFDLLRHKLLPELLDRRSKSGLRPPIRIWSAACSTGQEVYSIGIVLKETLGDLSKYNIRILGTDISDAAIATASEGIFNDVEIARGLSEGSLARYFTPSAGRWKIRDEIRGMACFRRLNLMEDLSSVGAFDIVFCRNVAIYFTDKDRTSLFNRIGARMEPDGQLIIGSMESLNGVTDRFESKRHQRCVYYEFKKPTAPALLRS